MKISKDSISEYIKPNAKLKISLSDYDRPDVCNNVINIEGNIEGFLSFMDLLIFHNLNFLDLILTDFDFIDNHLGKNFIILFIDDNEVPGGICNQNGYVMGNGYIRETENSYTWNISETEAMIIANMIHGFQYAWEHLHFDPRPTTSDIAVCFYLE